jgi:glycosyltransferase involved in cell wall biosynthesis
MMKVIQVLPEMNAGGVERGTLEIAGYLAAQGHEALVVSNGGRLVEALEKVGARHIVMPVHRKSLGSLFQVGKMRRLLEEEKPDIVHIRSRVPGWIVYLAWRKMDVRTRPRLVSTVHGFYSVSFYSAVMTRGERVIAVSESIREYIFGNYPKTAKESIRVIDRGIDPGRYVRGYFPSEEWLAEWGKDRPDLTGKEILLLPGRITRLKGHEDFLQLIVALKQAGRSVHGWIAGDTHPRKQAYFTELKAKVEEMGIGENVEFLGHRSDLREVMAMSDVVCALSQQPESFGRTVLEALAIGKPVVGYDCGGVGELLAELFPEGRVELGDAEGLFRTAMNVLKKRPQPEDLGGRFTLEAMCSKTLEVYEELLRESLDYP